MFRKKFQVILYYTKTLLTGGYRSFVSVSEYRVSSFRWVVRYRWRRSLVVSVEEKRFTEVEVTRRRVIHPSNIGVGVEIRSVP